MSNVTFTESELNLMSYHELRRLSIVLRLPANIKKKHMISMILAHQKGDHSMKTMISNKVLAERKLVKKISENQEKEEKSVASLSSTQKVSKNLSAKHEFETRFSYVARYTRKGNVNAGVSGMIKEKAEVSRRSRRFLEQPKKGSRKLSSMEKTEIELPRNHSLTTPVRLMPQYESGFVPPFHYQPISMFPNFNATFQDGNPRNYQFTGEFSNALIPPSSQQLRRDELYWHPNEVYNNSMMPISSTLLPTHAPPSNSSNFQYTPQNSTQPQINYQREINGNFLNDRDFRSTSTNFSISPNNRYWDANSNVYNKVYGNRLLAKSETVSAGSSLDNAYYQPYGREEGSVKIANSIQPYLIDVYVPKDCETDRNYQVSGGQHAAGSRDYSPSAEGFYPAENDSTVCDEGNPTKYENRNFDCGKVEFRGNSKSPPAHGRHLGEQEKNRTVVENVWNANAEDPINMQTEPNFTSSPKAEENGPSSPEIPDSSNYCSEDKNERGNVRERDEEGSREEIEIDHDLSRCPYAFGHDKHPKKETEKRDDSSALPSFNSTFSNHETYRDSLCNVSSTGTTETHRNPIMTCSQGSQGDNIQTSLLPVTNAEERSRECHEEAPQTESVYSYPEPETSSSYAENTGNNDWTDYSNKTGAKFHPLGGLNVIQVVNCQRHGYHYLYVPTSNSYY